MLGGSPPPAPVTSPVNRCLHSGAIGEFSAPDLPQSEALPAGMQTCLRIGMRLRWTVKAWHTCGPTGSCYIAQVSAR
jgi:hypothetical protein